MQFKEFDWPGGHGIRAIITCPTNVVSVRVNYWGRFSFHFSLVFHDFEGFLIKNNYYSFKIFPRFWLVKTTRIIYHKQLLLIKNSVILNQWRQMCSPLHIIEPLTSKWRQNCSPQQIIDSLTSKIIGPLTEKTWAQGCVIQQRENWPWVEFTSLSEEDILNE